MPAPMIAPPTNCFAPMPASEVKAFSRMLQSIPRAKARL
jgi:hypothetical protein